VTVCFDKQTLSVLHDTAVVDTEHAVCLDLFNLLVLQHEVETASAIADLCDCLLHLGSHDAVTVGLGTLVCDQESVLLAELHVHHLLFWA